MVVLRHDFPLGLEMPSWFRVLVMSSRVLPESAIWNILRTRTAWESLTSRMGRFLAPSWTMTRL